MSDWAVTVNVGSGPGGSRARTRAMAEWAADAAAARRPAFVFAQEVPWQGWVEAWGSGYRCFWGPVGWPIRSALLVRDDLDVHALDASEAPNLRYHGSYLAAAVWDAPLGAVTLVSAHASPSEADPVRYGWAGERPPMRHGGGDRRWSRALWDSDMVLDTLGVLSRTRPVLAAGDFNESREYDVDPKTGHRGTWGEEYFARAQQLGFRDVLHDAWGAERASRGGFQLDHVLVSEPAAALIDSDATPEIDERWVQPATDLSDHSPTWFRLRSTAAV